MNSTYLSSRSDVCVMNDDDEEEDEDANSDDDDCDDDDNEYMMLINSYLTQTKQVYSVNHM